MLSISKITTSACSWILLFFAITCSGSDPSDSSILEVKTRPVKKELASPSIASPGQIEPLDKAEIYSKTPGRIERLYVDQGESVKKGQVLIQMERLPLEIELGQLGSQYRASYAEYELARETYRNAKLEVDARWKRIQRQRTVTKRAKAVLDRGRETFKGQTHLYKEGGLSQEQYRQAENQLIGLEAEYRTALKDLEIAKGGFRDRDIREFGRTPPADEKEKYHLLVEMNSAVQQKEMEVARKRAEVARYSMENTRRLLNETTIRAPIDGVVAIRNKSPGEEISSIGAATSSAALLTIVAIDRVYAATSVPEQRSREIRVGQELRFTVDVFPDARYTAKLELISPVVDSSGTIAVRAILDNPNRELKPGMFIRTEIITGEPREVLLVPAAAIQTSGEQGRARIWLFRDGKAFPVEVKPGSRRGEDQIVEGEIQPGDAVILNKLSLLREGRPVESGDQAEKARVP